MDPQETTHTVKCFVCGKDVTEYAVVDKVVYCLTCVTIVKRKKPHVKKFR